MSPASKRRFSLLWFASLEVNFYFTIIYKQITFMSQPSPKDDFSQPVETPPWRALYPFVSHFHETGAGQLHYLDEGNNNTADQKTLLFVHGNPTWSFHWRNLIQSFSGEFRCVAMDHLGCGLSEHPATFFRLEDRIAHVVALIEKLDLKNITLVAQDWGGVIGLGAMLRLSDRCKKIVLFNTGAFQPWFIPLRIRACRIPLLGRLGVQGGNIFVRAALTMTTSRLKNGLNKTIQEAYLMPHNNWSDRLSVYNFIADIPLSEKHPTWKTLGTLEAGLATFSDRPILMVWGMRDWCFTPECLTRFEAVWPNAISHRLEDAGHWVVEDAADEVLKHLTHFLS